MTFFLTLNSNQLWNFSAVPVGIDSFQYFMIAHQQYRWSSLGFKNTRYNIPSSIKFPIFTTFENIYVKASI